MKIKLLEWLILVMMIAFILGYLPTAMKRDAAFYADIESERLADMEDK